MICRKLEECMNGELQSNSLEECDNKNRATNVAKALIQLKGTLLLYKNVFCKFGHVYARAIVTSSTPNLKARPEYVNLERMVRKDYKGNVKIVEKQFNEKDIEL